MHPVADERDSERISWLKLRITYRIDATKSSRRGQRGRPRKTKAKMNQAIRIGANRIAAAQAVQERVAQGSNEILFSKSERA